MYLKIHDTPKGRIVAACEEQLIGRVLEGDGAYIDLDSYRGFYIGKKADGKELKDALARFSSVNLVGKGPVDVAVSMGLIDRKDVMYINKIPYIQIYRL
ncbi:DUF424 family protein [Candidatus Micrarchaeota archaeon]|nr:DUF424 family protein [Candidatus Micrarchaeota archaeon]